MQILTQKHIGRPSEQSKLMGIEFLGSFVDVISGSGSFSGSLSLAATASDNPGTARYVCLFVCMYVRMYVCMFVYVCMRVCVYVCVRFDPLKPLSARRPGDLRSF